MEYLDSDGTIKGQMLVGFIDYDSDHGECIVSIDGKPHTFGELGRMISTFEGWRIKIEFAISDDEFS